MQKYSVLGLQLLVGVVGAHGMFTQLVLLRELLAVFSGNELTTGLLLAFWVGCEALGARCAGWIATRLPRLQPREDLVVWGVVLAAMTSAVGVLVVAGSRVLCAALPGEGTSLGMLVVAAALVVCLPAMAHGALFVLGVALLAGRGCEKKIVGSTYLWEGLGTVLAAVIGGTFLLSKVGPLSLVAGAGVLLWVAALQTGKRLWVTLIPGAILVLLAFAGRKVEVRLWERIWPGHRIISITDSPYGRVLSMRREEQTMVVYNGTLAFSSTPVVPELDEQVAVVPLLCHSAPRRVLLFGSNLGMVEPVLGQPVEEVTFVQMDSWLLKAQLSAAGAELATALVDSRLTIKIDDERRFLLGVNRGNAQLLRTNDRETESERITEISAGAKKYDCIILADILPLSLVSSRLFTLEFFRKCGERLDSDGILAVAGVGFGSATVETREMLAVRKATLRAAFPEVTLLILDFPLWICSKKRLDLEAETLAERLKERRKAGGKGRLTPEYLLVLLDKFRQEQYRRGLSLPVTAVVSTDLRPTELFFALVRDNRTTSELLARVYRRVGKVGSLRVITFVAAEVALFFFLGMRRRPGFGFRTGVATSGFAGAGLTVLTLFAYQLRFGSVYLTASLLLAGFLAGTVAGGWMGTRLAGRDSARRTLFLVADSVVMAGSPLPVVLLVTGAGSAWFFFLLVVTGVAVGLQFPLAGAETTAGKAPTVAGELLALDLGGGMLGSLLTSLVLVPVIGMNGAVFVVSAVKCASLAAQTGRLMIDIGRRSTRIA